MSEKTARIACRKRLVETHGLNLVCRPTGPGSTRDLDLDDTGGNRRVMGTNMKRIKGARARADR
eukprot:12026105-Karenia_brevis.AAC.1